MYIAVFYKLILLKLMFSGFEIEKLLPPSPKLIFHIIRQIWRYLPLGSFAKNFPPKTISQAEGNFVLFAFPVYGETIMITFVL